MPAVQSFFQRTEISCIDLPINLLQKMSSPSAGSEVLFHLPIPGLFLQRFKPIREFFAFWFGEMRNSVFDGCNGHSHLHRLKPVPRYCTGRLCVCGLAVAWAAPSSCSNWVSGIASAMVTVVPVDFKSSESIQSETCAPAAPSGLFCWII